MGNYYNKKYFDSNIFQYDYESIAKAVIDTYSPKTIIEFGCGNGDLSKAFYKYGVKVMAVDGFAEPDFSGQPGIEFHKIDLNNPDKIKNFCNSLERKFDVAICMEVAEHLKPEVSQSLIGTLTSVADVVIFSAAIPEQDGDGHINCQTRLFWHKLFEQNNFALVDNIRSRIRDNMNVAVWYRLNTVDYVRVKQPLDIPQYQLLVEKLIASESNASSTFYYINRRLEYKEKILNLDIIKGSVKLRNFIKKSIGRKPV